MTFIEKLRIRVRKGLEKALYMVELSLEAKSLGLKFWALFTIPTLRNSHVAFNKIMTYYLLLSELLKIKSSKDSLP